MGPFVILIVFILAALIGIFPEIIKSLISTTDLVIALLILSIASFVGTCASILFIRRIHDIQCQNCVDDLKKNLNLVEGILKLVMGRSGIEYAALVPFAELHTIEKNVGHEGEIWVSTDDFGNDETRLKDTIFENIEKEIRYVYFIPQGNRVTSTKKLVRLFNDGVRKSGRSIEHTANVLQIFEVPQHFFYMDFIIYNPSTEKQIILLLLPQNKDNGYDELYYRVPKGEMKNYIESLNQLSSGKKFCNSVEKVDIDLYNRDLNMKK